MLGGGVNIQPLGLPKSYPVERSHNRNTQEITLTIEVSVILWWKSLTSLRLDQGQLP